VDENGNLAGLVVAQFQATKNGLYGLYAVRFRLFVQVNAKFEQKEVKNRSTVLITTLDAAASSVTFSKSDSDATTVLTPRVFNTFALSAFLTRAVISSISLSG
jgi:hypothetical protein